MYAIKPLSFVKKDGVRYMCIVTSNAYVDREDDVITEKALEAYTLDKELVRKNVLLWWHGGEPIGHIVHAEMVGPFLLEIAEEAKDRVVDISDEGDPEPFLVSVKKLWDAFEKSSIDLAASQGFKPLRVSDGGRVYERILKVETSVLPRDDAANPYTLSEVLKNAKS